MRTKKTDLISRSKLHTSLSREDIKVVEGLQYIRADAVLAKISMAPSVDAVEVVRCKTCQYARKDPEGKFVTCIMWDRFMHTEGFCYEGRREVATDNHVRQKDGGGA